MVMIHDRNYCIPPCQNGAKAAMSSKHPDCIFKRSERRSLSLSEGEPSLEWALGICYFTLGIDEKKNQTSHISHNVYICMPKEHLMTISHYL